MTFSQSWPVKIVNSLSLKFTAYLYIMSGIEAVHFLVLLPSFFLEDFSKYWSLTEHKDLVLYIDYKFRLWFRIRSNTRSKVNNNMINTYKPKT